MRRLPPGRVLEDGDEAAAVGCEILGYCRECQFDTYHEVLEAKKGQIHTVGCRRCGDEHFYSCPQEVDEKQWRHDTRWDRMVDYIEWTTVFGVAALMFVLSAVWGLSDKSVERVATIVGVKVDYIHWSDKTGFAVYLQLSVRDDDDELQVLDVWHRAPKTRNYIEKEEAEKAAEDFVRGDTFPIYCNSDFGTLRCSYKPQGALQEYIVAAIFFVIGIVVLRVGWSHLRKKKKKKPEG